jgi:hypothetical protein
MVCRHIMGIFGLVEITKPIYSLYIENTVRKALSGKTRVAAVNLCTAGDIVRIAPNELCFASANSWKDIYTIPAPGKKAFLKTSFYGYSGTTPTIFTARDPHEHSRQRRILAHAFSGSALQAQEPIIHKYVDMFVQQMGRLGAPGGKGVNVTEAFNWLAFDVIGRSSSVLVYTYPASLTSGRNISKIGEMCS